MDIKNSIEITNVSVEYRLPHEQVGTFREYFIRLLERKIKYQNFRALDDVSLQVPRGTVHGVIGHNGAGKSTMLKVISRVIKPTTGRVRVYGKVAPLLELGAGFHPELTGKENIYLNGALLGFSREEMERLVDPIIDFSELQDFIDAPLRTYSSGMQARLGFAVATAVDPDILIVDEILGVGDEAFQKKCEDRMTDYRNHGTTIFLVSHDMSAIQKMCQQVTWLDHGRLMMTGEPKPVIAAFRGKGS
jgi:ABC-2 type transport system ATP-binding protein